MSSNDSIWLEFWSGLALIACVVVIVGVVLEGAELIVKLARKRKARRWVEEIFGKLRRRQFVSLSRFLEPKILPFETVGFAVLVIGLAIETLGSFNAERLQSKENAELNKEAGIARKDAGDAWCDPVKTGQVFK